MRLLFIILFALTGIVAHSQEISEEQRKKALSTASRFCSLLVQYSSGGEQYVANDMKIYDLCSSKGISAYNDLEGNKEDMLVSYLFTIAGTYNNKLDMSFSPLNIENVFGVPDFDLTPVGLSGKPSFDINGFSDVYVVISTIQHMGKLGKNIERKIIYSCNENKIISFSSFDSPYISLMKEITSYSKRDYKMTLYFADKVLDHKRVDYTLKNAAAGIAMCLAMDNEDINAIKKYGDYVQIAGLGNYIAGCLCGLNGNFKESLMYYEKSLSEGYEYAAYMLGYSYSMPDTDFKNIEKAKRYFEMGMEAKDNTNSGMSAFFYAVFSYNYPDDFGNSDKQILELFLKAGDKGIVPACLPLSILYEEIGDKDEAAVWAAIAAEHGSGIGKARLGQYYMSSSDKSRREKGLACLCEAANMDIDAELEMLGKSTGMEPLFPQSTKQLKQYILNHK